MSYELTAARVEEVPQDCLFHEGEERFHFTRAEGIAHTFGFHPGRLAAHRSEIRQMLGELPDVFKESGDGGGGGSFLEACQDRNGRLWAEHPTIEKLLCLGLAAEEAAYLLPRNEWHGFPGGMPYFVIHQ